MSRALDNADLVRLRLLTPPAAGELATDVDLTTLADSVIVDRQKKITSLVAMAVNASAGVAITILWSGYRTLDKNSSRPKMAHSYTIEVYSRSEIADGNLTADDVMHSVIARLWQWRPVSPHSYGECEVIDGGLVPDKTYLKYDLTVVIPILH